ncbi:uncharacterized protein LOC143552637 [Bidens hawaiensis]|uniref:uncharacterized protein LOC143552637 n=1 Tax=Bidens hawaiensis TaxID=980011 RepID=UPI00404917A2
MESSPTHSISRILAYTLALHGIIFTGTLMNMRTEMTNKNQSAFEVSGNGAFMIIPIIALSTVELTSGILFFTKVLSHCYTVLKFIGIFSANFAPFSLLFMSDHHPAHKLILHLVGLVIYALVLAYICYGNDDTDKNLNKSSLVALITYFGLVLVPVVLVVVFFTPKRFNPVVFTVIYATFGLEVISFCFGLFKVMKLKKVKPQNLEATEEKKNINQL